MVHKSTRRKHYRRKSRRLRGGAFWLPNISNVASYSGTGQGVAGNMNTNFGDLAKQSATVASMPNPNSTLTPIKASVVPNATSLSSIQNKSGGGDSSDSPVAYGTPMKTPSPSTLSPSPVAYGTPMKTPSPQMSGGRRKGRRTRRRRTGGAISLGAIASKSAAPFALLGMQQFFSRKRKCNKCKCRNCNCKYSRRR